LLAGGGASGSSENARFYQLEFYKPYFDVDTTQVAKRLLYSLWPFRTAFLADIRSKPDLYVFFGFFVSISFV
jgi:hypothetical protein